MKESSNGPISTTFQTVVQALLRDDSLNEQEILDATGIKPAPAQAEALAASARTAG